MGAPAAAKYMGISLRTLYSILDTGELPAYKLGRVIRMKRADVDAYLEAAASGRAAWATCTRPERTETRRGSGRAGAPPPPEEPSVAVAKVSPARSGGGWVRQATQEEPAVGCPYESLR